MSRFGQLLRKPRRQADLRRRSRALAGAPQKRGVCVKIYTVSPKKPNSAKRKVAHVKLSNKRFVICYIPGEGHNLVNFNSVLVRGGRIPDLPGVKYVLVRGVYDLKGVRTRRHGRSKYGMVLDLAVLEVIKFPSRPPLPKARKRKIVRQRHHRRTVIF